MVSTFKSRPHQRAAKTFSIVLMAVVDANYKFSMVDVGASGRHSGGGIFKACEFGRQLVNGTLDIPGLAKLPNSNRVAPHVFVGDEAFQLRPDFMRPFPGKALGPSQAVFNYRLSRARRIVENAFGILAARWRILLCRMNLLPQNAEVVVLACCVLHNFLCAAQDIAYIPPGYTDYDDSHGNILPGTWRTETQTSDLLNLETTSNQYEFGYILANVCVLVVVVKMKNCSSKLATLEVGSVTTKSGRDLTGAVDRIPTGSPSVTLLAGQSVPAILRHYSDHSEGAAARRIGLLAYRAKATATTVGCVASAAAAEFLQWRTGGESRDG
ncbi:uncharacterized protein LOC135384445 [Ornithodoros turicata]|uniref:uncharacterized protein LOC135384445 n=1 Tax=Ornithodoros turicata TaxID=34597 RepID=UPI0031391CD7